MGGYGAPRSIHIWSINRGNFGLYGIDSISIWRWYYMAHLCGDHRYNHPCDISGDSSVYCTSRFWRWTMVGWLHYCHCFGRFNSLLLIYFVLAWSWYWQCIRSLTGLWQPWDGHKSSSYTMALLAMPSHQTKLRNLERYEARHPGHSFTFLIVNRHSSSSN